MMVEHCTILELGRTGLEVTFEDPDKVETLTLGYSQWVEMGSPDTITITVESGDRLNVSTPEEEA